MSAGCSWRSRPAHQARPLALIAWAIHIPGAGLVLVWAVGVCAIPVEEYILLYAYPGLALTVLRSYCEHRAVPAVGERTGIVEAGPLMSLMYLNNNLHAVHHAKASLAWYGCPRSIASAAPSSSRQTGDTCSRDIGRSSGAISLCRRSRRRIHSWGVPSRRRRRSAFSHCGTFAERLLPRHDHLAPRKGEVGKGVARAGEGVSAA